MVEEVEVFLGFLQGQSYFLSAEQIVDNPVPRSRRGFGGGLHVYTQDRVLQRLAKQIIVFQRRLPSKTLTFQFCVVRLTIFIKILFLQLVLPICRIRQIKGVFALFPVGKSAKIPRIQGSELGADFSSWPP